MVTGTLVFNNSDENFITESSKINCLQDSVRSVSPTMPILEAPKNNFPIKKKSRSSSSDSESSMEMPKLNPIIKATKKISRQRLNGAVPSSVQHEEIDEILRNSLRQSPQRELRRRRTPPTKTSQISRTRINGLSHLHKPEKKVNRNREPHSSRDEFDGDFETKSSSSSSSSGARVRSNKRKTSDSEALNRLSSYKSTTHQSDEAEPVNVWKPATLKQHFTILRRDPLETLIEVQAVQRNRFGHQSTSMKDDGQNSCQSFPFLSTTSITRRRSSLKVDTDEDQVGKLVPGCDESYESDNEEPLGYLNNSPSIPDALEMKPTIDDDCFGLELSLPIINYGELIDDVVDLHPTIEDVLFVNRIFTMKREDVFG